MTAAGAFLIGLSALITSIASAAVLLLGQAKARGKVEQVHQLVNSQLSRQIDRSNRKTERNIMLENMLDRAGVDYPDDDTD